MTIHPLVLSELRAKAAALELRAEQLNFRIPGDGVSKSATKRHMDRQRAVEMAQGYRALIEWAESSQDA